MYVSKMPADLNIKLYVGLCSGTYTSIEVSDLREELVELLTRNAHTKIQAFVYEHLPENKDAIVKVDEGPSFHTITYRTEEEILTEAENHLKRLMEKPYYPQALARLLKNG